MGTALASCFFPSSRTPIDVLQPDNPDPLPTRNWEDITSDEISAAFAATSDRLVPGPSGIGYKLLRWAYVACPDRFLTLFNTYVSCGHHPWHDTCVLPLPKPKRLDYSLPKAYQPISLLECSGKLLEHIISHRVMSDINTYVLLLQSQFGSCDRYCTVDAALALLHTAQQGLRSDFPVCTILFDI